MVNEIVVRIIAERIIYKGENPLRQRPFLLDDVTNEAYRKAVEDYIIKNTADVTGVEEVTQ
ncbi:hypothetical protein K8O96_03005 [Clostridium sporogenes]|uniref:Uncharacterized protein n=1 Tax=Clostridium botulinum TaxID=1491 RepID=A0A6M0T028_CLOBO|nr:hypothetical protein [Clostridium sporogenes]NFA60814.1 hypothetical protein [Clostridium botulinum]NFI72513.1 hypothetical protein [Clostridium sporogenes]NFL73482.1 hypothetical protein [Clostridium sporogenes]NFM23589.1 hypothetical protein [Clostridium sporogenes]NFP60639.1 hypothetical protein [Clostridium sporogenes]